MSTSFSKSISDQPYKICSRCVMDTSDPDISFNSNGECNHCCEFFEKTKLQWFPNDEGKRKLESIVTRIKSEMRGKKYDCIMGLSGGVDSSYLALRVADLGLCPLVVHVDGGWNSELAVANIEKVIRYGNYDLKTHVVDWSEMRDLQVAYLLSGIANQDVPQDHIFFACLFHLAKKEGIRHIISGGNIATESIFPDAWHSDAMDSTNLKDIHRMFGTKPLRKYKAISWFNYRIWYPYIKRMNSIRPLDYMPYEKSKALAELVKIGYKPYKRKHGESRFTKFFQNYYLLERFGYDKRRPHLSSMIVSGQMLREDAILALKEPTYSPQELEEDKLYVCKKLQISLEDFENLIKADKRYYTEFANWDTRDLIARKCLGAVRRLWHFARRDRKI